MKYRQAKRLFLENGKTPSKNKIHYFLKEIRKNDDVSITIQHLADFDNEPMKLNQVWFCGVDGKGNSTRKIKVIN